MASDTHIICIGNELHGDDGIGPALHARLLSRGLPDGVRLMRADVASARVFGCFEACRRAIVVDALRGFGLPGSVHSLRPDQVAPEAGAAHGAGLGSVLDALPSVLDQVPEIHVIGVEVESISAFRPGLSAAVSAALDEAELRILERAGR